ncbi:hypothetical protein ACFWTE_03705 [Nocardiopsis sp. NPDC058631]|uniref:hypothetical protein n=1 Tax=Nocardiopsis sp. NPDC058631 TaxID=3346566 RepID=UPI0036656EEF
MPPHDPASPDRPRLSARPVSLPAPHELARAARGTPPLRDALAVARWCGPTTPVCPRGLPEITDVRDAVRDCGLWPRGLEGRPRERGRWLDRLDRVPEEFALPWRTAVRLGLVELGAGHAHPARDLEQQVRSPDRVLDRWAHVFGSRVEQARGHPASPGSENLLPRALRLLYEAPDGSRTAVQTLARRARSTTGTAPGSPGAADPEDVERLLRALWRLAGTGAVVVGRHGSGAGDDPRTFWACLTGLGRFGVRRILLALGVPAPLVEELDGAGELLDMLGTFSPESRLCSFDAWLAGRTPARALREIAEAVRGPGRARRRLTGTKVLNTTSSEIVPDLWALLGSEDPTAVGLAASVLLSSGMLSQHDIERVMDRHGPLVVIDMFAAALAPDEANLRAFLTAECTEGIEGVLLANVDRLRQDRHPDTVRVLEAIGRQHPDPGVAATAREAVERLASPP